MLGFELSYRRIRSIAAWSITLYHLRTVSDDSGANTVIVAPLPNTKTRPNNLPSVVSQQRVGGSLWREGNVERRVCGSKFTACWFARFGEKAVMGRRVFGGSKITGCGWLALSRRQLSVDTFWEKNYSVLVARFGGKAAFGRCVFVEAKSQRVSGSLWRDSSNLGRRVLVGEKSPRVGSSLWREIGCLETC